MAQILNLFWLDLFFHSYPQTGWYVGYPETVDNVHFFAFNIAINKSKDGEARIGIAGKVFQKLKFNQ
jgi:beta-lactamase class D